MRPTLFDTVNAKPLVRKCARQLANVIHALSTYGTSKATPIFFPREYFFMKKRTSV